MAPPKPKRLTLTKNSAALQFLISKFLDDAIAAEDDPKTFWQWEPMFQSHALPIFRTYLNNVKRNRFECNYFQYLQPFLISSLSIRL